MDIIHKPKVNKKISEILNSFYLEQNSDTNRSGIAYQIKCFLEYEKINYETVNLYTPPERVDRELIDIRIDDELYPFKEIIELNEDNWREYCIKCEDGYLLNKDDIIELFQYLINEGYAWNLQDFYKRKAEELIKEGYCTLSYNNTTGHYIWGNVKIPSKYNLKPNAPGTDEYVQKRKDLNDDEFFTWSNLQMSNEEETE
jgi:hypothetical protein